MAKKVRKPLIQILTAENYQLAFCYTRGLGTILNINNSHLELLLIGNSQLRVASWCPSINSLLFLLNYVCVILYMHGVIGEINYYYYCGAGC